MRLTLLSVCMALAVSGCTMTPDLVRPPLPVTATYPSEQSAFDALPVMDLGWRTMFGDPRLQALIDLALQNNRDLRLATLNVEAVQAQYRIQRAEQLPSVGATGNHVRQRVAAVGDTVPAIQKQTALSVGLSSFELDLWGRVRSMSDAAFARYLASEEGRRAAQISLVAAVADAYFAERLAQEQSELTAQTLANWTEYRDMALRLKSAGQNNGLDIAQAESQVARARADIEARSREAQRARNALVQLVGTDLAESSLPVPLSLQHQPIMTRLPAGVPSDLLVRRPDIRQAERQLEAANADIGAARAAFFPTISLTASTGYASASMGGLFKSDNRTWSFAPQITIPLFNGGRLRAELRLSELRKSAAVAEYERAIQIAFREVSDGLAGSATYGRQIEAQAQVVAQETRRLDLSNQRYRAGVDGRLEWLDAQRQLYTAQQGMLDLRRQEISNAVALYKSLGGGLNAVSSVATDARQDAVRPANAM